MNACGEGLESLESLEFRIKISLTRYFSTISLILRTVLVVLRKFTKKQIIIIGLTIINSNLPKEQSNHLPLRVIAITVNCQYVGPSKYNTLQFDNID